MTDTMQAVVLTGHGGLDKLEHRSDWPKPVAEAGEALVKVLACGLNNTDVNTRTGWYSKTVRGGTIGGAQETAQDADATWGGVPISLPRIQGADVCGVVEAVGAGVDAALVGKRVLIDTQLRDWSDPLNREKAGYYGSECDGGFAEYTKVDARNIQPIDSTLSDAELATFATAYITAENMLRRATVAEGDVVLIPGASGGVGSALIQLAHRRGAKTIAMSGDDKAEAVAALGPEAVLPRAPENLEEALFAATGRRKVSVVADVVGGPMWPQFMDILSRGGRYACAGAIAGPIVEFDLRTFYLNDLMLIGATVVPPGVFAEVVGYIERGEVKPILAETYPLSKLHDAQTSFLSKRHVGNIVVAPDVLIGG